MLSLVSRKFLAMRNIALYSVHIFLNVALRMLKVSSKGLVLYVLLRHELNTIVATELYFL